MIFFGKYKIDEIYLPEELEGIDEDFLFGCEVVDLLY